MVGDIVRIDEVSKSFQAGRRSITAIDHLSMSLQTGSLTGLVGPDGAGKTTIMRLIAGLDRPDSGSIAVFGLDSIRNAAAIQGRIGYMPQRFGLYEDLTVNENLRLYADLHGLTGADRDREFERLLSFTGLGPFTSREAGRLSGGMKQKLGLACTLIGRPGLLLLDEPSVGVDPLSRRELWSIVRGLARDGATVLWSTSYLDEADRCDDVILLAEGRVLGAGPPHYFTDRMRGRTYHLPLNGSDRAVAQLSAMRNAAVLDAQVQGGSLRIVLRKGSAKPAAGAFEIDGTSTLKPVEPRFEDAFIELLNKQGGDTKAAPPGGDRESQRPDLIAAINGVGATVIETDELTRMFGDFCAVDKVSIKIRRGEIFGLLGPNGAGKSTTFKMLCGLLPSTSGAARVAGIDMLRSSAKARGRIGYMSQKFSLYGDLTVRQNLDFFAGVYGLSGRKRNDRVEWVVAEFDLSRYLLQNSADLPIGYKQRLALGAALMHEPDILFLDEPTSGVDPLSRRAFWTRINAMASRGVTIMVTSHFMEEAEYCDRLAIMYGGRIIATGTPEGLKSRHRRPDLPDPTLEDAFVSLIEEFDADRGS